MTPLPHNPAVEKHVLAVCLLDEGPTYQRAIHDGVTDRSFHDPKNRIIWKALARIPSPSLELLAPELGDHLSTIGGFPYLMELTSGIGTTAHAGHMIEQLIELESKREIIARATDLIEHAQNGTSLAELSEQAKGIAPDGRRFGGLQELMSRRVTAANPPKEPVTRLFLNDKPVATPGNLQTITAKSKAGKTVATGAATAAVIVATSGTGTLHDTFKFRASNPQGHAVIIIDTEQSPFDAWACYQRILARAGETQDPPWLLHFALVGYSVAKRKAALLTALEYAKKTFGGVFLVIIDGVAHFVSSVNELEECNLLADWLRELSVTYDTAMLCVIHSNEGLKTGDDSRGHLGKQLMRDAESNLLLKKVGEVTTITSEKQRKAPITEEDGIAFKWSEEHGRHVSCAAAEPKSKGGRPKVSTFHSLEKIWPRTPDKALTQSQIHNYARDEEGTSESTLRRIINDAVMDGQLIKIPSNLGNKYCLRT